MASIVRESKFRNTLIGLAKREFYYEQLKISDHQIETNGIASNSQYLAYMDLVGGGSSIAVLPLSNVGKIHIPISAPAYQQPLIRAHTQPVQDIQFNPFQLNHLCSCSTDGTIKLWEIPNDGFTVDTASPLFSISGVDNSQFREILFHPFTEKILISRTSRSLSLFDLNSGSLVTTTDKSFITGDLQSMCWSGAGDLLAVTGKDKTIRLIDIRRSATDSASSITAQTPGHTGTKGSRVVWLGESSYFVSSGHSSSQERELFIWDSRALNKPVKRERLDTSTGLLMPLYDPDTCLLTIVGRGDSSLRLYEAAQDGEDIFPISTFPIGEAVRGCNMLPKQACDLMSCEVVRVLVSTATSIIPVSCKVPRKEKQRFQEDLYPPTRWGAPPALSSDQWLAGETALPNRIPVPPPASRSISTRMSDLQVEDETPPSPVDSPISDSPRSTSVRSSYGSALKFRHLYGTEAPKTGTYFNVRPSTLSDNALLACSDLYWAVPYQGSGGGPVYVSRLDAFGKVLPDCPVINGHKAPVCDLTFSPFHNGLLATAGGDCKIKLWQLPEQGSEGSSALSKSLTESDAAVTIAKHGQNIRTIHFHPTVANLLAATSQDMTVRFFDLQAGGDEVTNVALGLPDSAVPNNLAFNNDGSLMALSFKDRILRIIDPRAQTVVMSSHDPGNSTTSIGRNFRLAWCCGPSNPDGAILTVSSSMSGTRMVHVWDPRNMSQSVCMRSVDNGSGQLYPLYDEGSGVCYVVGKGDTIVRYYEISFLKGVQDIPLGGISCEKANEFQSGREPFAGMCLMSKRAVDVRNVEVSRMLKLTVDTVVPISFHLSRANNLKEYFQDDVYLPIRSKVSTASVADWTSRDPSDKSFLVPNYESLQPAGMSKLSEKPPEPVKRSKAEDFKAAINQKEEEDRQKEETFSRLAVLANQRASYHPNKSGGGPAPVRAKVDAKLQDGDDEEIDWDAEP